MRHILKRIFGGRAGQQVQPIIDVYKHVRADKFLLLRKAIEGEAAIRCYGDFIGVSREDLKAKGLNLILSDFEEFPHRDGSRGSVIDGISEEAKKARKFLKDFRRVTVSLQTGPESALRLGPVTDLGRGRGVVRSEDVIVARLPSSNDEFFEKLLEAFDRC